jgi:hypothetical protein
MAYKSNGFVVVIKNEEIKALEFSSVANPKWSVTS